MRLGGKANVGQLSNQGQEGRGIFEGQVDVTLTPTNGCAHCPKCTTLLVCVFLLQVLGVWRLCVWFWSRWVAFPNFICSAWACHSEVASFEVHRLQQLQECAPPPRYNVHQACTQHHPQPFTSVHRSPDQRVALWVPSPPQQAHMPPSPSLLFPTLPTPAPHPAPPSKHSQGSHAHISISRRL